MAGDKYDGEKPPLYFNPPEIQYGMSRAFAYGAKKYSSYNWLKGLEASRLYAACIRHLLLWFWEGTPDAESGLDHLDHAAACLAMLMDNMKRLPEMDDRPIRKPPTKNSQEANDAKEIDVTGGTIFIPATDLQQVYFTKALLDTARRNTVFPGFSDPDSQADGYKADIDDDGYPTHGCKWNTFID